MNKLSWNDVETAADTLKSKMEQAQFCPDCLIGVITGGLFPLALLATRIKGKDILTVTAKKHKSGEGTDR